MTKAWFLTLVAIFYLNSWLPTVAIGDEIPKIAWKRPLGAPLPNPGKRKNNSDIDDGYWQGAPVGGFGAGTFSRTYRGDFARWHIKSGVHKYAPIYANQFAMFQQVEGEPSGTARVLMTDHPKNEELSSWAWDYPTGAGEYAALYPKSFHEKAGECQVFSFILSLFFFLLLLCFFFFQIVPIQPSRLCRHPSIRTLC